MKKCIRFLTLLVALTMISGIFVWKTSAFAKNNNITYRYDKESRTLYIESKGKIPSNYLRNWGITNYSDDDYEKGIGMPDRLWPYDEYMADWRGYEKFSHHLPDVVLGDIYWDMTSKVKNLVIGEGITEIDDCAFDMAFPSLENISFPTTLQRIGDYAFRNVTGYYFTNNKGIIKSLVIPDGVKYIGKYAFENISIKSIKLPDSLNEIERGAFIYTGLENITFPKNLKLIKKEAFAKTNLKNVILPDSVKVIYDYAFYESALKYVKLPKGLEGLGYGVFAKTNLTELVIPQSVCKNQMTIHKESGVCEHEYYDRFDEHAHLFPEKLPCCTGELKPIAYGCKNLKKITVLDNKTPYSMELVSDCPNLEQIVVYS